ncbi:WD40 repeat-like protein [Peniophora sp. CONT]|nr:WD40 repeat-like protein [Peniophora sp. CONT]
MTSKPPPAPSPIHLIRHHTTNITSLYISSDNERLYSADASGRILCSSTRSLRPIASWQAHSDSVLGVEEVKGKVVTQGRDHKLFVWRQPERRGTQIAGSATVRGEEPGKLAEMDVNALNYCRFSILPSAEDQDDVLIALPNLVESAYADIWRLESQERVHAAVGKRTPFSNEAMDGRGKSKSGIIMLLHLLPPSELDHSRLLMGFENGSVVLWGYDPAQNQGRSTSVEGVGWTALREWKVHVDTIMGLAISTDYSFALSVSADHLLGKYDLVAEAGKAETVRTKHPGHGSIAIKDDGRVCAVGGWDGNIRLYSTKSSKPLGTLSFHRKSVDRLVFAHSFLPEKDEGQDESEDEDEDEDGYILTRKGKERRGRWIVSGDADGKVAVWELVDFGRK